MHHENRLAVPQRFFLSPESSLNIRLFLRAACLIVAASTICLLLPESATAAGYFPWTCRQEAVTGGAAAGDSQMDLRGEWISSFDPKRVLDIRERRFSLQGTGGNLAGPLVEHGPSLILTDREGNTCIVLWQLLGDGRLAINSGEDMYHRRGDPALPVITVRQYGSSDCRFTITLPERIPVEEVQDGVRVFSVEKDTAMQILSGKTTLDAEAFARAICDQLKGSDFRSSDDENNAFLFTATVRGIPMLQYIAMDKDQYLHVSLMGDYAKLMSYLKTVKIMPPREEAR